MLGGLLVAAVLSTSRWIERALLPLLVALNAIPKVAVAPLLIVWLGFGALPKIVMVVLICFFPIVVATTAGLTSTPAEFQRAGPLAVSLPLADLHQVPRAVARYRRSSSG